MSKVQGFSIEDSGLGFLRVTKNNSRMAKRSDSSLEL
jgi:hypothetical protein